MHSVQIEIVISIPNKTESNRMCKFRSPSLLEIDFWSLLHKWHQRATLLKSQKSNRKRNFNCRNQSDFVQREIKKEKSF